MENLGKLSIREFKPKTAKTGKERTKRKKELCDEFLRQNENLSQIQESCKGEHISIRVTFHLNRNTLDTSSYKKDLDNLLKILMDVIKEEMDDVERRVGLGLVMKNQDEDVFEIICRKDFVDTDKDEGIDLEIFKFQDQS